MAEVRKIKVEISGLDELKEYVERLERIREDAAAVDRLRCAWADLNHWFDSRQWARHIADGAAEGARRGKR